MIITANQVFAIELAIIIGLMCYGLWGKKK